MNTATRSRFRGAATAAASLATLAVIGLAAPSTAAAYDEPAQARSASRASAGAERGSGRYYLKFTKNLEHPDRSTLSLVHNGFPVKTYRAGSGLGVTDECRSNKGWLPNGTYQVTGHQTNRNSKIKGYAIQLSDKKCHPKPGKKAVTRGALFIHSEMTKNGGRGSTEPTRWDGDKDYKSNGCIKLHPDHIKDLFSRLENHWPDLTLQVG
ncbi:L,D-transpeptidase [Streptomyces sp. NPDC029216]|uniref:L,D-transpeptidase n=1 Tax=Streptomyces sp. NPDC029216 TaxID=3154701 RepID=UPI0033DC927A